MVHKKLIGLADNIVIHEFEYFGNDRPVLAASHMDVTARTDGPFLGKVYDQTADTFSDPPAESGG